MLPLALLLPLLRRHGELANCRARSVDHSLAAECGHTNGDEASMGCSGDAREVARHGEASDCRARSVDHSFAVCGLSMASNNVDAMKNGGC